MKANRINTPKVSVIVPVWNPGPGVSRCIESLRSQTLKDIEIIFVDDCGTDDAMERIYKAALKDTRIQIIANEKNIGPGASRNKGIEVARGEYLSFIDPDDYVEIDFLEKLYKRAKAGGYDIVKGQSICELYNGNTIRTLQSNGIIRQRIEAGDPLFCVFTSRHFSAIYRRSLIIDHHVRYGKTYNSEDSLFLLRACHAAISMALEDMAIYHYVQRTDSLTNQYDNKRLRAQIDGLKELLYYLVERIDEKDQAALYAARKIEYNLQVYIEVQKSGETATEFLKKLKEAIIGLPFLGMMKEQSLPVKILAEDGIGLALAPRFRLTENGYAEANVDIVKGWVDYACSHPSHVPMMRKTLYRVFRNARQAIKEEHLSEADQTRLKAEFFEQSRRLAFVERCRMQGINSAYRLARHLPDGVRSLLKRLLIHS